MNIVPNLLETAGFEHPENSANFQSRLVIYVTSAESRRPHLIFCISVEIWRRQLCDFQQPRKHLIDAWKGEN